MEFHNVKECTLENLQFYCKDKSKCIALHQLCDHSPDCLDKSDEGGMCANISKYMLILYNRIEELYC